MSHDERPKTRSLAWRRGPVHLLKHRSGQWSNAMHIQINLHFEWIHKIIRMDSNGFRNANALSATTVVLLTKIETRRSQPLVIIDNVT